MNILLKLFKGILWFLLLFILLAVLTVLSWWMQWPLFTGAAILLSCIGLVLAFFGARALYRWRDKAHFVRKVLDEQSQVEAQQATIGRMAEAWRSGMDVLRVSPSRFYERLEFSQPWFLVVDSTGSSSDLFAPFGETLPEKGDSPLFWHFLSALVLLRFPEKQASSEDWKDLLAKLVEMRRHMPLRGIVLLLKVADLAALGREELAAKGHLLRAKAQQIMLTLNRKYPVYILVEGLETLPGMDSILDVVPADDFDAVLGQAQTAQADARGAVEAAAKRLEDIVRDASVRERRPKGDMLEALCSLRAFGDTLKVLVEQVTRVVAHQSHVHLAGICFCQREVNKRPAFLTGLISYILPTEPHPAPLTRGLPFVANTRACVLGAWLLLLLGLCGLMGVNVLYQNQALTESRPSPVSLVHDAQMDALFRQMLYIKQLEKAQSGWYLPLFGLDALSRALVRTKADFTGKVYTKLLHPLLSEYKTRLASAGLTHDQRIQMGREILWLTSLVSKRVQERGISEESRVLIPMLKAVRWDPVEVQLIVDGVQWMAEGDQVNTLAHEIRTLLAASLAQKDGNVLEDVLDEINSRYPAAEICLAHFWPHVSSSDPNNVCIKPAYTTAGYRSFKNLLHTLETLDDTSGVITQNTEAYRRSYFRQYAELWVNFTKAFSKIRASMQEGEVFISYADIRKINDMPHYHLLQTLAEELTPLQDAGRDSPRWLSSCMLMDVVTDIAEFEHREKTVGRVRALLSLVASAPELMQRLRAETKDAKEARQMLEVADTMRIYFDDTLYLLKVVTSPEKSYALASSWFGGHKVKPKNAAKAQEKGGSSLADEEDIYANAKKHLERIVAAFKGRGQNPMLEVLPGILDFIAQGVTIQTAKVVQQAWEDDVLGSAAALYRQDDVSAIFGDKGVVQNFVETYLKPFLMRKDKALVAASWGDIEFPFTSDGLRVLSTAEMIAAQPPEDTYYVLLRSQPTLVNVDAKERADSSSLTLKCQDKTFSLVNRNYPREEKFQYTVKQCGPTVLQVNFPSFTLKKEYDTFTDFLKDFQYGERDFSQDDFENVADKMESAGVHSVTVRILADNVSTVLQKEGNEPPALPDRLTYVW